MELKRSAQFLLEVARRAALARWGSAFAPDPRKPFVSTKPDVFAVTHSEVAGVSLASTLRVLLVDDCHTNRMIAGALLSCWGIEPAYACDGVGAVKLAQEQAFDVILMDVSMPVMDGLEATAQIRSREREHPDHSRVSIVAYTSGVLASNEGLMRRIGIDAVLKKPCNAAEMGACLKRWGTRNSAAAAL